MKKLFLSIVAMMAVCSLSAQSVTETFNKGAEAYGAKDYATAAAAFEQVIDEGQLSDNEQDQKLAATAKGYIAKCYFQLGGRSLMAKDYAGAIEHFTKSADLATLYGDSAQEKKSLGYIARCYQAQGGEAFNAKDYATAAAIFEKGYAADPKNAQMANWLGTCYCELGNYAQGLEILNKVASNANPKYAEQAAEAKNLVTMYTNNMVAGFQQNGDYDGMLAAAEQMLATNAENAVALKIRVQAYEAKKDYAKVIELAEAAALAQTDAEDASYIYYLLGSVYNAKEMKPQAIEALKKVTAGASVEAAQAAIAELSK